MSPGLFAAVFLVTISYSVITSWGLLKRFSLQCGKYSRLKWRDCHGDRLPGVRSCMVLGIYNPQTCLGAGRRSYQGRSWKSFSCPLKGSGAGESQPSVPRFLSGQGLRAPMGACCFCSCVLLLCSSRPERQLQKLIPTA